MTEVEPRRTARIMLSVKSTNTLETRPNDSLSTLLGRLLGRRSPQRLAHFPGIETAQIVAAQHARLTIAVPFPEGNGGGIGRCRFKLYPPDSLRRQALLDGPQQFRADSGPAARLQNVNGNDVRL